MAWMSAAIAIGGSLISGAMSSDATSSAANTAASAADRATQLQYQMYQQNKADVQPWLGTGQLALSQLATWLGLPPTTMQAPASVPLSGVGAVGAPGMAAPGLGGGMPGASPASAAPPASPSGWDPSMIGLGYQTSEQLGAPQPAFQAPTPAAPASASQIGAGSMAASPSTITVGGDPNSANFGALTRPFSLADVASDPMYALASQNLANLGPPGSDPIMALANKQVAGAANDPLMGVANANLAATTTNPMMPLTLQSLASTAVDPVMAALSKGFNFSKDPGYDFRLQQGLDAVQNRASALGGVNSGATLKALGDYAQGQASSEYNNAFARWAQQMGLMGSEAQNQFSRQSTALGQALGEYGAGFGRQATAFGQAAGEQQNQFNRQSVALGQAGSEYNADFSRRNAALGNLQGSYQNAFNRWNTSLNDIFSRLSSVSGTGANAGMGMAGIGTSVAGQAGANTIAGGNLLGAGQLGSANALSQGINGAIPGLQQLFTSQVPTPVNLGTITGADAAAFW